jgi:hypothetical protein
MRNGPTTAVEFTLRSSATHGLQHPRGVRSYAAADGVRVPASAAPSPEDLRTVASGRAVHREKRAAGVRDPDTGLRRA